METTTNSALFLSTFNELEKHFKHTQHNGHWKSFKQMLKESSRSNPIVWQFKEELFEFADLRNAIVHNRAHNYEIIAEPHSIVVERFATIKNQIINPDTVKKFHKPVITCTLNSTLKEVVELFHQHLISGLPIIDHNRSVIDILTASTISYWLAESINEIKNTISVSEIIKHKEYQGNYEIIPQKTSVYHASEIFKQSYRNSPKKKYYDALLITENGKASEKLSGIIVLSDIAEYL